MSMDGGVGQPEGWYPDPHKRSELRWFDGAAWTTHVSNGGVQADEAASPAAASGALLYGNLGHLPPSRAARPMRQEINGIGPGFFVALVGIVVVAASCLLPWINGITLFNLEDERTYSGYLGTSGSTSSFGVSTLQSQLVVTVLWLLLVLLLTTTRVQPGPLLGFLLFGCIGLIVCWQPIDRDDRSARSNVLGMIVVILHGMALFALYFAALDRYTDPDMGSGPIVLGIGLFLTFVGVLLGRGRRVVEVPNAYA